MKPAQIMPYMPTEPLERVPILSTDELWAEFRRLEEAFKAGALRVSAVPQSATTAAAAEAPLQAPDDNQPAASTMQAAWDQAARRVQRQLQECEEQLARHMVEQTCLQAQLAAYDGILGQVEQWRQSLRQRVERDHRVAATLEQRKLERLKELQVLADGLVLSQVSPAAAQHESSTSQPAHAAPEAS